jgi:hypothetical protein
MMVCAGRTIDKGIFCQPMCRVIGVEPKPGFVSFVFFSLRGGAFSSPIARLINFSS